MNIADVPFSRPLRVSTLPAEGTVIDIAARPDELSGLARSLGIPSVESLSATLEVKPLSRGMIRVRGQARAELHQGCVVTMEPFPTRVAEEVEMRFAPPEIAASMAEAVGDDLEAEDPPDPYSGDHIDLGAVAREFVALGLDPYPRKPGAVFAYEEEAPGEESPFARLAALKPKVN